MDTIRLQKEDTFKISGVITSGIFGKPIPNAIILSTNDNGTESDSIGRFTIYNLPRKQIKLTFNKFGYFIVDTVINIEIASKNDINWTITTKCDVYNKERAYSDIKAGNAKLVIVGGEAPIFYTTDKKFKKKYKIEYALYGCIPPDMEECIINYKTIIFKYLDKHFGENWRHEIRKDVKGL